MAAAVRPEKHKNKQVDSFSLRTNRSKSNPFITRHNQRFHQSCCYSELLRTLRAFYGFYQQILSIYGDSL